jgi:3'-phosphoadenosine 5'-phosphosulfate sulfotransferase (PAPS reductase)/FAD synthetase
MVAYWCTCAVATVAEAHIVALSGGKDSTAMALRLRELQPDRDYLWCCTPTGDELPEMFDHWRKIGEMLGKPIQPIIVKGGLKRLVRSQVMIPNHRARWCTRMLKIEPWGAFLLRLLKKHDHVVSYVGLRADEMGRKGGDFNEISGVESRYPLREWGWGLNEVLGYLQDRGVTVPARTDCARCFYQRVSEWWTLWKDHPEIYADAESDEEFIAEERGKAHTWRNEGRDSWPADLASLRKRFEIGERPRGAGQMDLLGEMKCRVCRM